MPSQPSRSGTVPSPSIAVTPSSVVRPVVVEEERERVPRASVGVQRLLFQRRVLPSAVLDEKTGEVEVAFLVRLAVQFHQRQFDLLVARDPEFSVRTESLVDVVGEAAGDVE